MQRRVESRLPAFPRAYVNFLSGVCFANSQNKLMYRPLSTVKAIKPPILENSEDPHEFDDNRDHPFAYIPSSRTF